MMDRDEQQWIGGCLTSVKDMVDEMIEVDTGSTDQTSENARSLGAGVYCSPSRGSFMETFPCYEKQELSKDEKEERDAKESPRSTNINSQDSLKASEGCSEQGTPITISLCMIVRQEEGTLERLLQSVKDIVDEINIVDTGSTDRTKEIAYQFTDRVFDFQWIDDFAAARNFSFTKATKQYILWLDADDILQDQDRERFTVLKQMIRPSIDRITMPYNLSFDGEGNVNTSLRRNRLVRRDCNFQWIGAVHEYLAAYGTFLDSDVCITHHKQKSYTDRNLQIYRKRQQVGETFSTRDLYYFANELRDHALYEEAARYYDLMLTTEEGWIEDNIQACLKLSECYTHMGNQSKRFESLARALRYEIPRPEVSCALGEYFFGEKKYETAAFWYQLATEIPPLETMGMSNRNASTWYPHLQLCLCYDRIGDFRKAFEHNEYALQKNPTHPSLLYNRNYFRDTHHLIP
ncbi:glycosyltransferase [Paenibacillus sp. N3/727]|uniref:glycosyltransferase n=1 Tax=Paenibacillus sp. N3/727 TaxID=2925845 RepID=UPI001F539D8C|nr:glycosyltransferase [Paenibacillus sp. N3/727]UNK21168.1 glycosyltransferase [Paenibacillus sp. N3/727]